MKKTQLTDIFTTIRRSIIPFLSVFIFVNLAVSLFCGISWAGTAFAEAVDDTAEAGRLHDISVSFPYGMTDGDIEALLQVQGVEEAEGSYTAYVCLLTGETKKLIRVTSVTNKVNTCTVLEGRLPENTGEIAVEETMSANLGISVGDTLSFAASADDGGRMLHAVINYRPGEDNPETLSVPNGNEKQLPLITDTFTVSAVVKHPENMSYYDAMLGTSPVNGDNIRGCAYVLPETFDSEAFSGYSTVGIRCSLPEHASFDDEYYSSVNAVTAQIKPVTDEIARTGNAEMRLKADSIISENEKRIASAENEISAGEQKIADGEAQIEDARQQISDGEKAIEEGRKTLASAKKKIEEGRSQIADAEALLSQKQAEYDAAAAQIAAGEEELAGYQAGLDDFLSNIKQAEANLKEVKDTRDALNDASGIIKKWSDGEITLDEAVESIKSLALIEKLYGIVTKHPEVVEAYKSKIDAAKTALEQKDLNTLFQRISEIIILPKQLIGSAEEQIEAALWQYNSAQKELDAEKEKLEEAKTQLADAAGQLASGRAQLEGKKAELQDAENKYNSGLRQLRSKETELQNAGQELIEAEKQMEEFGNRLADSKAQLAAAKDNFEKYRGMLDSLAEYDCIILTRKEHIGIQTGGNIRNVFGSVRYSMAGLFVIVGLLVCYFAILRIVNGQVTLIGTQKAIGFRSGEIYAKYLLFTGIAVAAGCFTGVFAGKSVVEKVILSSTGSSFNLVGFNPVMQTPEILFICAVEAGLLLGATYLAVRAELKKNAVELLAGTKPPEGRVRFYEKFRLWNRLSLLSKTVVNNFFTEQRRVLGTFIGIAGCTALFVTAFTLNDNILKSYKIQFGDYFRYDSVVRYEGADPDAERKIGDLLRERGIEYTCVTNDYVGINQPDGSRTKGYLTVFDRDDENFRKIITINPVKGETGTPYEGIWMSASYLNYFGEENRGTMSLMTGLKQDIPLNITGYYEYHVPQDQIFATAEAYREAFGKEPVKNAFLISSVGIDIRELEKELRTVEGYNCIFDFRESAKVSFDVFKILSSALVYVFSVLSVVMAVMVLLNLLTMFVEEKKKELIVLMINGFPLKTVRKYISGDTVLLTVLGIAGGIALGYFIGIQAVRGFETSITYFLKEFDLKAAVIGTAGTALLSFIMCRIALRRVDKFKITDINK